MSAIISECGTYRYELRRSLGAMVRWYKPICFIMLNPSTADATLDDPTIRRCMRYAASWGYGNVMIYNLFAYRSTDPKQLKKVDNPVGKANNAYIYRIPPDELVVCAWGTHGGYKDRDQEVLAMLRNPMCLRVTKAGYPAHPLYLPKNLKPIPYGGR